jgi:hypothetical protein
MMSLDTESKIENRKSKIGSLSRGQIAVLHVAKKALCLSDDEYRGALLAHGDADSAKSLDYKGFRAVMMHFERCGFKQLSKQSHKQSTAYPVRPESVEGRPYGRPGMATDKELRKIYASWWALGGSYYERGQELRSLRGFLRKRFRVDHENFLSSRQAWQVIEGIKGIGGRLKVEGGRLKEGKMSRKQLT